VVSQKTKSSVFKKLFSIILVSGSIVSSIFPYASAAGAAKKGTNYPAVFVSGYAGWGEYEHFNNALPYWGRLNGDLIEYLNSKGIESYAASVNPLGSAWDRACELYAQLSGTVVDYGAVHSKTYKHLRFGHDFSKEPLINGWGKKDADGELKKVNFIAHSFGGATVRLLAELLANGSPEEMKNTSASTVSGLFTGGKAGWIYSITTLASPHNGTDSVLIFSPVEVLPAFDSFKQLEKFTSDPLVKNVYGTAKSLSILRIKDTGLYDLFIDGADELNEHITTIKTIYYFSIPNDGTVSSPPAIERIPDKAVTDPLFRANIFLMGRASLVTEKGTAVDKSWYNNDGVVNTISTRAPKNEPQRVFNANKIEPGVWNIMKTYHGDHAAIIGGLTYAVDINELYLNQLKLINSL